MWGFLLGVEVCHVFYDIRVEVSRPKCRNRRRVADVPGVSAVVLSTTLLQVVGSTCRMTSLRSSVQHVS